MCRRFHSQINQGGDGKSVEKLKGFAARHLVNENRNNGGSVKKSSSTCEKRTFQYQ